MKINQGKREFSENVGNKSRTQKIKEKVEFYKNKLF